MMSAIGTGNIRPGVVTVSLGTSGTICAFAEEPVIDPERRSRGLLRCDRSLAAAHLHDERRARDRADAHAFRLGYRDHGAARGGRARRRGRSPVPSLSVRRTHSEPAERQRHFPWPNDREHDPGFHGARGRGRRHPWPRLRSSTFQGSRDDAGRSAAYRRRQPQRWSGGRSPQMCSVYRLWRSR